MEQFTFFYETRSPFSQWHPSTFVENGVEFNTAEQYMMYHKALLFGDAATAQKILTKDHPRDQKALGREVRNFDSQTWTANCKQIVYRGNHAKFDQNPKLRQQLLATQGTTLVEASPTDAIWGIGLKADDPRCQNRATWLGTNWLGEVLTWVREDLLAGAKRY